MKYRYAVPAAILTTALLLSACNSENKTANNNTNNTSVEVKDDTTEAAQTAEAANSSVQQSDFQAAIDQYRSYVIQECDAFVTQTGKFVDAVNSGDIDTAKALYAPARMHYERIEPIAEALGDLDPNIDARDGDVEAAEWRGFHRIEKALWEDKTTEGQKEYADRLLSDAKLLRAKVETVEIDASLLVTGAVELLNEVSTSKVTGEEERYSHTDLYDFAANVEGAAKIYELLKPQLAANDAELDKQIGERFAALEKELAPFREGEGYVTYDKLTEEDVRTLSQNLDALAEPLSNMGKLLGV
ncbi:iron uptake system component EfeO [Paenibacillus anaericanus]|uniref:iron uptake system protein EfeO n=1 Tax=Paenibacillus anaericanus TaxID=170367 RepID=UPI0027834796|nr:iron uptake system protein EfeO [Paenibacillus anaericanus]MDQ0090806.1 iron uptake system component EfeO [Paenibacillus anaericanus]